MGEWAGEYEIITEDVLITTCKMCFETRPGFGVRLDFSLAKVWLVSGLWISAALAEIDTLKGANYRWS
jgi:hypothetical protein